MGHHLAFYYMIIWHAAELDQSQYRWQHYLTLTLFLHTQWKMKGALQLELDN